VTLGRISSSAGSSGARADAAPSIATVATSTPNAWLRALSACSEAMMRSAAQLSGAAPSASPTADARPAISRGWSANGLSASGASAARTSERALIAVIEALSSA